MPEKRFIAIELLIIRGVTHFLTHFLDLRGRDTLSLKAHVSYSESDPKSWSPPYERTNKMIVVKLEASYGSVN